MNQLKDNQTRTQLIDCAIALLGQQGYDGTTMRQLAEKSGVKQPVIYYYFHNKDDLLEVAFGRTQQRLAAGLAQLPPCDSAGTLLRQRIAFTWQNADLVMAMLNYFLGRKRSNSDNMKIPSAAYRHIQDAIDQGIREGRYYSIDPGRDAGIILHAINGFAMEYFPESAPSIDDRLLDDVCDFFERALCYNHK